MFQDDGTTLIDFDFDDGDGLNFLLDYVPPASAYYKLRVKGWNAAAGAYTFLYYQWVPADTYEPDNLPTDPTTITPTLVDQSQSHGIHSAADEDWYAFQAVAGRRYTFYSTGYTNTYISLCTVVNNEIVVISSDDNSGPGNNYELHYIPTTGGIYGVVVSGVGSAIGDYMFHYFYAYPPDIYEDDDSSSDYTVISPTVTVQSQSHSLDSGTDQDWFRFYGSPGRIYSFYSTGTTDTKAYLYLDDGTSQCGTDDDGAGYPNFLLEYVPTAAQYFKLKVIGYSSSVVGLYTFNYQQYVPADSYEPDDSATDYNLITPTLVDQSQPHGIHSINDEDYFRFLATAGRTYTFYSTGYTDTYLMLFAGDGTTNLDYDDNDGVGNNFNLVFAPSTTGYYFVAAGGYLDNIGDYEFHYYFSVPADAYESDNTSATAQTISMSPTNSTQNHTLHSAADEDWFRFYAYTGRIYTFSSTGNTDTRGFLYLDNGTTQLDWDDDDGDGYNFSLQFTPISSAYYKLKVDGYDDSSPGAYVFNRIYSAYPDIYEPDDTATQYTTLNVTTAHQIQEHTLHTTTEADWFRFQGVAGRVYDFYSTGNTDTQIYLYQDNGTTQLEWDDDGDGYNFHLQYAITATAYYKFKVIGWGGAVGAYTFHYSYTTGLTVPINVQITPSGSTVTLTWNAVIGATNYKIQASDNPYSGFAQVGTSATTSWTGPATAARKFYRVIAMN